MTALLHTLDLLSASRIASAAQAAGVELVTCAERDAMLPLVAERDIQLVLLDLATPGEVAADWIARLRSAGTEALSIVAYGPHVNAARLAEARQAGCDRVLARGQFLAQVSAILTTNGKAAHSELEH
jgi:DNA-binding response OmpR family regulator